jgi:hypothetical protein
MDAKNVEALGYGADWMLAKFVNLPSSTASNPVADFVQKYGELCPGWDGTDEQDKVLYMGFANEFRKAWFAYSVEHKQNISELITRIFERERDITTEYLSGGPPALRLFADANDRYERSAVVADFETGKITIKPRTLLDWLAKCLLENRRKLAFCKRKGCQTPYYVKMHPRHKYCSVTCASEIAIERKKQWWRDNRGKERKREATIQAGRRRSGTTSRSKSKSKSGSGNG